MTGGVIRTEEGEAMRTFVLLVLTVLCVSTLAGSPAMTLTSPSFSDGGTIPKAFTCDGADKSPSLNWTNVPEGARSLILICHDPDAPGGDWVHWILMDISTGEKGIAENGSLKGTTTGQNSWKKPAYGGPCPPPGKPHRYIFTLYALDTWLAMPQQSTKLEVERRIQGHILAKAQLMGTYKR